MSGDDIFAAAYNSYIKQGSVFFSWMMDKCYCKENHFQKIKAKKVEEKKRVLIPEETREKINEYLKSSLLNLNSSDKYNFSVRIFN